MRALYKILIIILIIGIFCSVIYNTKVYGGQLGDVVNTVMPESRSLSETETKFYGVAYLVRNITETIIMGWLIIGLLSTSIQYYTGTVIGSSTDLGELKNKLKNKFIITAVAIAMVSFANYLTDHLDAANGSYIKS